MPRRGSNLPDFREAQLSFAAHIRNPDVHPKPADVESRRMQIYLDLFYNNIESFLASGFPVARKLLIDTCWHDLVRDFVHTHASESPYFLEISQEFLTYLGRLERDDLPDFLLELCHYEWVELALSVSETEIPTQGVDPRGDLLKSRVVVSPLIWKLAYRYPVHQLGPGFQPTHPPAEPTQLVVYRGRDDRVRFLVANAVTIRLLEILQDGVSGADALDQLAAEMPGVSASVVQQKGIATLTQLREAEILLGTGIDAENTNTREPTD